MQNHVTEAGHPQILEVTANSALNALFNIQIILSFKLVTKNLIILLKYLN